MNIENFTPFKVSFPDMFSKQNQLRVLYEPDSEEVFNNFDIDTHEDQEVFKKYCWRITEELMEALEDRDNERHFQEEIIDGLNFLMDLYSLYGWSHYEVSINPPKIKAKSSIEEQISQIIYKLGITANLLKNRTWRKSQYLVDLFIFEPRFKEVWHEYMELFSLMGMSKLDIKSLWSLKYQVNKFRIESNY